MHRAVETLVCVLSIALNSTLLCIILRLTSRKLSIYKMVLVMACVSDLVLSTVVLLVQQVRVSFRIRQCTKNPLCTFQVIFFTKDGRMVLASDGIIGVLSPTTAHTGLAIACALLHSNLVCIVCQFVLRYRIVCKHDE